MKGDYLALGEEVDQKDHIICNYHVISDDPISKVANAIAAEQTTGTWTEVTTFTNDIFKDYGGLVTNILEEKGGGIVTIAYPLDDFSPDVGGIPQLLTIIAGNLFGLGNVKKIRLESLAMPSAYIRHFRGPSFGIKGLRRLLDRKDGIPFLGTIVKPKIGLDPKEFASYVYEAAMGGLTNSKDDETLVDQSFCPLSERTMAVADAIDRVRSETGHRFLHAINISTRADKILELADKAQSLGATQLMVDYLTCGITTVQAVAEDPSIKVPIHVHRAMHGALTRDPLHGISMSVLSSLARLAGSDALHVGTFGVGKMKGSSGDSELSKRALTHEMSGLSSVVPVASGGMYPGIVGPLIEKAGPNIQIQAGGGVSGHPGGVRAGARAMVQAAEAAIQKVPAREYAKDHKELAQALEKWGEINADVFSY